MTMSIGAVTSDGSGSGCAKAIYDALIASGLPATGSVVLGGGPGADHMTTLDVKDFYAKLSNAMAGAIIQHIKDFAWVNISPATGGLQTSTAAGNPTDPPSSLQVLTVA